MKKNWLLAVTSLLLSGALLASSALAQPVRGGILRIATANDPLMLDSRGNPGTGGIMAAYQVQEGLVTTDLATGEAAPALAESWEVSPDGLTYTFHLREGVKFHDGTDFSSADVLYTFEFVTGERPGGIYVSQFAPFIELLSAPDDYTFIVQLTTPWEDFLTSLHRSWAFLILSQEAVETAGNDYGTSVMVGTGPFQLVHWRPGEELVLERNPDYWNRELPYLDGIHYQLIRDGAVRVLNARTGTVDIAQDPPIEQLNTLGNSSKLQVAAVPGNPLTTIQLNTSVAPFSNQTLRQALHHGIDRASIVEAFYGDYADVADTLIPAWHWLYEANDDVAVYDPELAKELLASEGYDASNPLTFELMVTTDAENQQLGVIIQALLSQVNMNVKLRTVESATRLAIIQSRDGQSSDEYQAGLWGQTLPGSTTDDYIQKFYAADGTLNRMWLNQPGGHQDPEIEKLINAARTSATRDQARELYADAIDRIQDAAVLVPLFYKQNVNLLAPNVEGFTPIGTNSFPLSRVWLSQ